MKFILSILILAACVIFPTKSVSSDMGKVVFIRDGNLNNSMWKSHIYSNDSLICKLADGSFYSYECQEGFYSFNIDRQKNTEIKMFVEKNRTQYVMINWKHNFFSTFSTLILVDSINAQSLILQNELRDIGDPSSFKLSKKYRVGLLVGNSFGINKQKMYQMTNNETSSFSFGSGNPIGLVLGASFGEYFDIEASLAYNNTALEPYLDNVTFAYSKWMISATPSFVVAFDGGFPNALKFGVGADYYAKPVLTFNERKIGGGKDTWTYKPCLGIHGSLTWQINYFQDFSISWVLKYRNAKTEIERARYTPDFRMINKFFTEPDASGIDINLMFNYHFGD